MTRNELIAAVKAACETAGFDFKEGFGYRIASQTEKLPAAWLEPPKLEKKEGLRDGIKHYSLKLVLLDSGIGLDEEQKEQAWGRMEERASQIALSLAEQESVKAVTDVKSEAAEFSLTPEGELSVSVSCKVQMPFYAG